MFYIENRHLCMIGWISRSAVILGVYVRTLAGLLEANMFGEILWSRDTKFLLNELEFYDYDCNCDHDCYDYSCRDIRRSYLLALKRYKARLSEQR